MDFFKALSFPPGNINSLLSSLAFKCVFWQSCQSLGKSLFMEIIKTKRARQEACFFQGLKWNRIMSVLKDGSTLNTDGIDETPSFLSPGPPVPEKFYLLLSRTLYYTQWRNFQGRVRNEEKKKKKPTTPRSFVIQGKREQSNLRSILTEQILLGPVFPKCNLQSLTALNFKLLNHFSKGCVPICWWEITVIPLFSHHFLTSHC